MAIMKEDISSTLDRLQRNQLERVEQHIDEILAEQYVGKPLVIEFSRWSCIHSAVWAALERRYRRAGWAVTLIGKKRKYNAIELG
ncbi:MAG: hypothetical protein IT406_00770 [Candidatus Yanofskybacteria bacterium]|nr:hypothetical protein [Candidatus Yanofskybacteria bacterium]